MEFSGQIEGNAFVDWPVEPFARLSYTWLADAEYEGERFSSVPGFTTVKVTGNRLPYAPEHLLTGTVGLRTTFGFSVQLEGVYTSQVFTDDLNTEEVVANGQRGEIPGYTVWNLSANYDLSGPCNCTLFFTAKNLSDKSYVADMTRGLIPGIAMSSFGSPAYFVPTMFADNRGDIVLSWSLDPLSYSRDNLRIPFFASGKVRARSLTGMNLEFFSGLSTTT